MFFISVETVLTPEMKFCFTPSPLRLKDLEFGLLGLFTHISDLNTSSCALTPCRLCSHPLMLWLNLPHPLVFGGRLGGATVLGNLPMREHPTVWITVAWAYCTCSRCGWGLFGLFFTLICPFSALSPSLWETARYRLKYCLKGPLNPKQPTNQTCVRIFDTIEHNAQCTVKHLHQEQQLVFFIVFLIVYLVKLDSIVGFIVYIRMRGC